MAAKRATTSIQTSQQRQIHALRRELNLYEADYRGLLAGHGAASSSDLNEEEAEAVIRQMRKLRGSTKERAEGGFAGKLQALWIAGWNLGVIKNNSDAALHAWMDDRFGVTHTRFLRDQTQAQAVIEGLKAWLERTAGVDWPSGRAASGIAATRVVLTAQWHRAVALDAVPDFPATDDGVCEYAGHTIHGRRDVFVSLSDPALAAADLYRVSNALGVAIRGRLRTGGGDDD